MATAQPSIVDLTTEQFDSVFKCNVYAMFWITKAAMPHLKPGATIINTSSVEAYTPSDAFLDYAQTKACNVAFTKSLAKQVAKQGIRVNVYVRKRGSKKKVTPSRGPRREGQHAARNVKAQNYFTRRACARKRLPAWFETEDR